MLKSMQWIVGVSAIVLLLSLAATSYLSSPPPSHPNKQQSSTETKIEGPNEQGHTLGGFVRFMLPDSISIFTFWLALATAGLGIIAVYQISFLRRGEQIAANTAQAAKDSADVAKSTLIASQRAWIRVNVGVGNQPLIFYPKGHPTGATVSVSFKVTNVGNTPATNITYHAWLIALKQGGPFPDAELEARCGAIRHQQLARGFTLFPNETFPGNLGFGEWSLGVGISPEELEKGLAIGGGRNVSLHVVGCVDYTFPTDATNHHQAGFIFELRRKTDPFILRPEDGDISPDYLELRESGAGDGRRAD